MPSNSTDSLSSERNKRAWFARRIERMDDWLKDGDTESGGYATGRLFLATSIIIFFVFGLSLVLAFLLERFDEKNPINVCSAVLPTILIFLGLGFFLSLSLAITKFVKLTDRRDRRAPPDQSLIHPRFANLADDHREQGELWFNITLSIFLGGLVFAVFHIGSHTCGSWMPPHPHGLSIWERLAHSIFPSIFVYALFFVSWQWAVGHFKAHWNDFISNQYKAAALVEMSDIGENRVKTEEIRDKIGLMSAALLLMPPSVSYMGPEEGGTGTAAERVVELEEVLREVFTHRGK